MVVNRNLIIKETAQQINKEKIKHLRKSVMWFYEMCTIMFASLV